jgi:polyhydroxyalkanoate synthesis regulator phasin
MVERNREVSQRRPQAYLDHLKKQTQQYTEELQEAKRENRNVIRALTNDLIESQRDYIKALTRRVSQLTAVLISAGVTPPPEEADDAVEEDAAEGPDVHG